MECQRVEPSLSAWVDGQLPEAQAAQVRNHLARCPSCWEECRALERVAHHLAVLQTSEASPVPDGLLTSLRVLPHWLVWVAVLRRWIAVLGALAVLGGVSIWLLSWSDPLRGTLTERGAPQTQTLSMGTTLVAQAGETATLALPESGTIVLQGPGMLIVRHAEMAPFSNEQRLTLELPRGTATIRFTPNAPVHRVWILTPQARLHLAGTWVTLSTSPISTETSVLEGTVQLENLGTGEQAWLKAGVMAEVTSNALIVRPIPVKEWLSHKGLLDPSVQQTPSNSNVETSAAAAVCPAPAPLWHEQTE